MVKIAKGGLGLSEFGFEFEFEFEAGGDSGSVGLRSFGDVWRFLW